jgi:hypothetical protein
MQFLGIGDLHFRKLDNIIPDASQKIAQCLHRVLGYALNHGVQTVLFYGDICEVPRLDYAAEVALYSVLLDQKYRDLDLRFVLGNHDFQEDGSHSMEVMQVIAKACKVNFKVYTEAQKVKLEGERFKMLPYPFTDTEARCVNVGHFEAKGSLRDNGKVIDEGVDTDHDGVMGHLHTNHQVRNFHYSGTLYQTNFGESEKKFFHHCKVRDGRLKVNNVPFDPPWILRNVQVTAPEDVEVLEKSDRILYKLFVKNGVDLDLEALMAKYPNIVKSNFFKTKQELQLMVSDGWKLDKDLIEQSVAVIDERAVVKKWLGTKLDHKQVKRGIQILDSLQR